MDIVRMVPALDAADVGAVSAFWAAALGGTVDAGSDGEWHEVVVDGRTLVAVQRAPHHVPPQWPDGDPPQQAHLCLTVADPEAARDEVLALGAVPLDESQDRAKPEGWWVYADPAGHPFCLCWG